MLFPQTLVLPRCFSTFCATKIDPSFHPLSSYNIQNLSFQSTHGTSNLQLFVHSPIPCHRAVKSVPSFVVSKNSHSEPGPEPEPSSSPTPRARHKARSRNPKDKVTSNNDKNSAKVFPTTIPRKPRHGRRSEAMAVEDFIRDSLDHTFASIQQQSSDVLEDKENVMKERVHDKSKSESSDDEEEKVEDDEEEEEDVRDGREKKMVIEEESKNWPLDADVGWGIRASDYFDQHPIKNVIGDDGVEIDWEGEIDDNWVQEINCLEWESFAFHPSPLVVLVFERYNRFIFYSFWHMVLCIKGNIWCLILLLTFHRATDNWKILKELEKAIKAYWSAEDRLPPRV